MKNTQTKVKNNFSKVKHISLPKKVVKLNNSPTNKKEIHEKEEEGSEELLPEVNKKILKKYKNFWKLGNKDFNTQYFDINEYGELIVLEGNYQYNIKNLVEKYYTSLEIFFPFILRERVNDLMDLFRLFIKYYKYYTIC